MKTQKKQIAERIQKARKELGITQAKLSKAADIGRSSLVHYENAGAVPGGIELIKLSKALNVTPNYLLSGSETFLDSGKPEHMLSTDNQELLGARMTLCFLALDKPVREKMSELIISMIQQKLSNEEFEVLMTFMDELGQGIQGINKDMEKLMEENFSEANFPKTTKKSKKLEKKKEK
jgi:transcriptional regulator with XRE-family HTH domain